MIKRIIFITSFLFCVTILFSQDYEQIDATVLFYPNRCKTPQELSKFITRDFKTDEEKVRAIYSWIIQNIAYNPDEYKRFDYQFKNFRERNKKEEKMRKKIINHTLKTGQAVCEGYSFLFEKLCELQGIQNYVVRGDTKAGFSDIGRTFKTNHTWNVAYINGKPYLFDPTWGAGRYTNKFVKDTSYFYYKTPPEQLIKSHYPVQFEDAFLKQMIRKEEFFKMPLLIDKKTRISDLVTPKNGILDKDQPLNRIFFKIKNRKPLSVSYQYNKNPLAQVTYEYTDNTLTFSIPFELEGEQLLIYFDGKPALGYKIK